MSAVPRRSNRLRSRPTAKKPKTIETTLNAPNHTTGSKLPIEGRPMSRRKCASLSRSNASAPVPPMSAMPISSSRGAARARTARRATAVLLSSPSAVASTLRPAHEAGLGHQQRAGDPARDRHRAADDDCGAQRQNAEADEREQADERTGVLEPRTSQKDVRDLLHTDLVGDPRLVRAARERVRDAPERPQRDDERGRVDDADEQPGDSHAEKPDDERQRGGCRCRRRCPSAPRTGRRCLPSPSPSARAEAARGAGR